MNRNNEEETKVVNFMAARDAKLEEKDRYRKNRKHKEKDKEKRYNRKGKKFRKYK